MRGNLLRMAMVLCATFFGVTVVGCESTDSGEGAYQESGGNQRTNLPEDVQGEPNRGEAEMNVDTGEQGYEEAQPGRQEESTPQAGGSEN